MYLLFESIIEKALLVLMLIPFCMMGYLIYSGASYEFASVGSLFAGIYICIVFKAWLDL